MVPRSPEIVEEGAANVVGRYHARELGILRRCDKVISVDHRDRRNLSERGRDSLAQIAGQLAQDIGLGHSVLDQLGWHFGRVGANPGPACIGLRAMDDDIAAIYRAILAIAAEIEGGIKPRRLPRGIEIPAEAQHPDRAVGRSEEHTSELQSLIRNSYA